MEKALLSSFPPAVFGCEISCLEQWLFSLPVHIGHLCVDLPSVSVDSIYAASRHATGIIVSAIKDVNPLNLVYTMI